MHVNGLEKVKLFHYGQQICSVVKKYPPCFGFGTSSLCITERRPMIADGLIGPELIKWKASVF